MESAPYILRELFFKHIALTSPSPLAIEIEKAEGVFLYTSEGKKIIDLVSGVCVSNVGHGNREVIRTVVEQIEKHMHLMVYGEIIQSPQVELATLLTSLLDNSLNTVYYVNSGSEANEVALKLAKRVTGRREIISFYKGYHGSTHGALSVMGDEEYKNSYRPLLPGVRQIRFNSLEDLNLITNRSAAVMVEPVMGEAGVIKPDEGYLNALRERCTKEGALLIFDEVQTGFGRTGSLFAHQKNGVTPDVMTLAKALGGGMPLGAVLSSKELMGTLTNNPVLGHITTFGGHPVCCASGLASLKYILKEELVEKVEEKSAIFVNGLRDHPLIKEIRAEGLLIAVDLGCEERAKELLPILLEEGIMSDWFLFNATSFRIAPPLTITNDEAKYSCEKIIVALNRL